jgi:carbonic anhydrase/acetyltransferase-like protein (isoleucine patch superfamily)
MIYASGTKRPKIHSTAYVAPTATIAGEVTIGADCAILHGAVIVAEGAPVTIGSSVVVMEHAVVKSSGGEATQFPVKIGDACIVGIHASVIGATLGSGCFVAAGARVYNGVTLANNARLQPNEVKLPKGDFFETVFNLETEPNVAAKAAKQYAQFLRKAHAHDKPLDAHDNVAPGARRRDEPDTLSAPVEADTVVDIMMLELQEMELRRAEAKKKK